jgi:hypothetical protein
MVAHRVSQTTKGRIKKPSQACHGSGRLALRRRIVSFRQAFLASRIGEFARRREMGWNMWLMRNGSAQKARFAIPAVARSQLQNAAGRCLQSCTAQLLRVNAMAKKTSKSKDPRYLDIHEDDELGEVQRTD